MRYGVLADVHGNLHALRAVLDRLRRAEVERFLCLGDLVGYGPFPNECVRMVAALPGACVAGNHDLIAVGRLSDERCGDLARTTMAGTRRVLEDDTRRYLETLPLRLSPEPGIAITHGGLGDPERYVVTKDHAAREIERLAAEHPDVRLLLVGHTHRSLVYGERSGLVLHKSAGSAQLDGAERFVLNPGAVGQARQFIARARTLVLDPSAGTATFHAVRYDTRGCGRALSARGLPPRAHIERPSVRRGVAARARRLVAGRAQRSS
jgi:predicted phosphodiesterase